MKESRNNGEIYIPTKQKENINFGMRTDRKKCKKQERI